MKRIHVVGVNYEGRQKIIEDIVMSFKKDGTLKSWRGNSNKKILEEYIEPFEFEGQRLLNAIDLEKEPNNPHDPNAIKVMMYDAHGGRHHVGYIPKDQTEALHKDFKIITQVDVEVDGGRQKVIEEDNEGNDVIKIYKEIPCDLTIYIADFIDKTNNKMFSRPSELTRGQQAFVKVMRYIVLGLVAFIILLYIFITIS